jgi:hypothetical protein
VAPEEQFELKALRTGEPFAVEHVRRLLLDTPAPRFGAELRRDVITAVDAHCAT